MRCPGKRFYARSTFFFFISFVDHSYNSEYHINVDRLKALSLPASLKSKKEGGSKKGPRVYLQNVKNEKDKKLKVLCS